MEFNPDRYVQPPLAEQDHVYQTLFSMIDPATGMRAMTIEEIRAAERLSPIIDQPPGDTASAEFLTGART